MFNRVDKNYCTPWEDTRTTVAHFGGPAGWFLEYLAKPGRPLHSGLLEERPNIRSLGTAVNEQNRTPVNRISDPGRAYLMHKNPELLMSIVKSIEKESARPKKER